MATFLDVSCSLDNSNLLSLVPEISRVRHQELFFCQFSQLIKKHHFFCETLNGIGNFAC